MTMSLDLTMAILNEKIHSEEIKKVFFCLRDKEFKKAGELIKSGLVKAKEKNQMALMVSYYCALGLLFRFKENYQKSNEAYLKAETLLSDEPSLKLLSARMMAEHLKLYDQAIKKIALIIPQIKNNFLYLHNAYTTLGIAYFYKGNLEKSEDFLKRSMGDKFKGLINPGNLELILVQLYLKKGVLIDSTKKYLKTAAEFSNRCQEKEFEKFLREVIKSIEE